MFLGYEDDKSGNEFILCYLKLIILGFEYILFVKSSFMDNGSQKRENFWK